MSASKTENGVISQHSGSRNQLNKGKPSASSHVIKEQIEDIKKEEGQVDAGPVIPTIRSKGENYELIQKVKEQPIVLTESVMENEASSNSQPSSPRRNPTSVNKNIPVGATTNEENDTEDNTRRRSSRNTVLHSFADRTCDASPAGCSQKADPKENSEECSRKLRDRSSLAGKYFMGGISLSTSNPARTTFKCLYKAKKAPANQIAAKEKPRRFKCDICEKRFLNNGHLQVHKRIHTGDRPFKCNVCETSFNQIIALQRHTTIHTVKRYACSICDKKFVDNYHLRHHECVHSGVKPYECSSCEKRFSQNSSLRTHERIHTGVKPYTCSICDKRFNRRGNLRKHESVHNGTEPFSCMHCGTMFAKKEAMVEHREKEHPSSSQVPNKNKSPVKVSSSNYSNNSGTLTEKESNSINETNAGVSTQDAAVLAGNSNNSLRDSTINKDMGMKVVKRRAISAENGATVHLELGTKTPGMQGTQVKTTLTETHDNAGDISSDRDTSEYIKDSFKANLKKNSESLSKHPVVLSPHLCFACKIGFPDEEGLKEHNRNTHLFSDLAQESSNIDVRAGYPEEEPLPAKMPIELELKDSMEEVTATTNIVENCSTISQDNM